MNDIVGKYDFKDIQDVNNYLSEDSALGLLVGIVIDQLKLGRILILNFLFRSVVHDLLVVHFFHEEIVSTGRSAIGAAKILKY